MQISRSLDIYRRSLSRPYQVKAAAFAWFLYLIILHLELRAQTLPINQANINPGSNAKVTESAQVSNSNNYEFIAVVNGEPISKTLFDLNLQEWISQGKKDTPALRKDLKDELINRELIMQEVSKQGLDRHINIYDQLQQLKYRLYVQIYVDQFLKDQGLNEASIKQDYQNQKKQDSQNPAVVQYKLKQITLREKSSALAVIHRLEQGESFDLVASQLALAGSAKVSTSPDVWVNANQLPSALSQMLSHLPIGGINTSPLAIEGGWLILKLEDERNRANGAHGKFMGYEEYKNQKVQALLSEHLNDTLRKLRSGAKINQ